MADCDVAIVGGGPAGLGAARELARRGLRVVLLDREGEPGGVPRHCGHSPFGMREFGRILRGADYARRLAAEAAGAGAELRLRTTVTDLAPGGILSLAAPEGVAHLAARAVLLATGAREASRVQRLIGGTKPAGVLPTGALQGLVHPDRRRPFLRPVILGTELVSFSALLTCRHAGIAPVAMVEAGARPTAFAAAAALPALLGVPLLLQTEVTAVLGRDRVEAIVLRDRDGERALACDGLLLTGDFRPEAALIRASHLAQDPATGGPAVDQFGRCSDPAYFAAGNVLRPIETAGWSWDEGRAAAGHIAAALAGQLPPPAAMRALSVSGALRYAVPQRIAPRHDDGAGQVQLRVAQAVRGWLSLRQNGREIWGQRLSALPERRILLPLSVFRDREIAADAPFDLHLETAP